MRYVCQRGRIQVYVSSERELVFSVLEDVSLNFCPHVNIAYMPSQDKGGQRLSQ